MKNKDKGFCGEKNSEKIVAYAVLSKGNSMLTFYYDTEKDERGGLSVGPFGCTDIRWKGHATDIKTVVFDESFFHNNLVESTAHWFEGCIQLKVIDGIENLKTNAVKDMSHMFQACSSLETIDVSNFITSNVKDMEAMFQGCSSLETLDVYMFDTRNVKNFTSMFEGCTGLIRLEMCNLATEINALLCTTLYDEGFHTDNAFTMHSMFRNCKNLKSLDLENFNTSKVVYMSNMFEGCSSIEILDLSNFITNDCRNMDGMFRECPNLKTVYVSKSWKTPLPDDWFVGMFDGCISLIGGNGTTYEKSVDDFTFARIDKPDEPGYFTEKILPIA